MALMHAWCKRQRVRLSLYFAYLLAPMPPPPGTRSMGMLRAWRKGVWVSSGCERAQYKADMRDKGLDGRLLDTVVFFNDIYREWSRIHLPLSRYVPRAATLTSPAALAVTEVMGHPRLGLVRPGNGILPHDPVAVAVASCTARSLSCWNGFAVFDANRILPTTTPPTVPAGSPLVFRGDAPCPESECFAIAYDMRLRTAPQWARTYVNVQVNVAVTGLRNEEPFGLVRVAVCCTFIFPSCAILVFPPATSPGVPAGSPPGARAETSCPESESRTICIRAPRIYAHPQVKCGTSSLRLFASSIHSHNWLYYGKLEPLGLMTHAALARRVGGLDLDRASTVLRVSDYFWLKDEACAFERRW
ncbi:hypothetical protein DFH06DRAFT_1349596 [Mycena polygramma]|nr:hypothetical protein DFH06DRAFT_1349596 [Mycena polygramma]